MKITSKQQMVEKEKARAQKMREEQLESLIAQLKPKKKKKDSEKE